MKSGTESLIRLDRQYLWHPFTQMKGWCDPAYEPLILVEGDGAILRDSEGREYIDGNSSIWTNVHGHRHPAITAAIKAQLDKVAHVSFLGTTNEPAIRLAEKLVNLLPSGDYSRVFFTDNGSTAIEVAVKMTLQYWQLIGRPEKNRFVAFDNAYHGDTVGAASLGGVSAFTQRFAPVHFPIDRVSSTDALERMDANNIAAIIIEPMVQGAAGIRLWPEGMLRRLRTWCDAHEVHLILDEVLTGFGRTGKMFACQHEGVRADFLCLAKGLTGGYVPLAATLTNEKIYSAFLGEYQDLKTFFYGHSFCGNPVGCAAALASLEVFETEGTLFHLVRKIDYLRELLSRVRHNAYVFDIRQCGFISGIEIRRPDGTPFEWTEQTGARVCQRARSYGLLTRPVLDTLVFMPPYCITTDQMEAAFVALDRAILDICQGA